MRRRGDRVRLTVDSLAFGGEAVGRTDEGVVFVAGAAPGDAVEVRLDEVKRGWARGALLSVTQPGGDRVTPRCPLVEECGSCQWQHVDLAAQRRAKDAIVRRALARLGVEVAPLATPAPAFGYRTRVRLTVGAGGRIGFSARRSHAIVDVPACPLLDPRLEAALTVAREQLGPALAAGASLSGLVGRDGVQLAVEGAAPAVLERAPSLVGRGGIRGVLVDGHAIGDPLLDVADEGEAPFWSAADGFAQVGTVGTRALRAQVAREVAAFAPARVLELYAGDGNFTRDLVAPGREVVAVEGARAAIARLPRNAPAAVAVAAPVEEEVARRAQAGERWDLVVMDPPRTGARAALSSIARLTDRVVYVSCDPMILARDAAELASLGLRPTRATAFDLTPQTYHVETVAVFERR